MGETNSKEKAPKTNWFDGLKAGFQKNRFACHGQTDRYCSLNFRGCDYRHTGLRIPAWR